MKFFRGYDGEAWLENKWVQLVMKCVRSVSYYILVNGKLGESFTPNKGLRQGDPLSPYCLIICAKGLSCLLQQVERRKEISSVVVAKGGPKVSHLLFANDCIILLQG